MTKRETKILKEVVNALFNLHFPGDPNRTWMIQYLRTTVHRLAEGYTKQAEDALMEAMRINAIIDAEIKKREF